MYFVIVVYIKLEAIITNNCAIYFIDGPFKYSRDVLWSDYLQDKQSIF